MAKLIIRWENDEGKEYGQHEYKSNCGEIYGIFCCLTKLITQLLTMGKYEAEK